MNNYIFPKLEDNEFALKLYNNPLFNAYTSSQYSTPNPLKTFIKKDIQEFLSYFINPSTPYKSLLMFHGVGVGKTCAAISIAENFKFILEECNKKIYVIGSRGVISAFKKQIFNLEKEKLNKNKEVSVQCTGKDYSFYNNGEIDEIKIKKYIKKFYNFSTPSLFENQNQITKYENQIRDINIKLDENNKINNEEYIKYMMKKKYDDSIIIIDEVHTFKTQAENENINIKMAIIPEGWNVKLTYSNNKQKEINTKESDKFLNQEELKGVKKIIWNSLTEVEPEQKIKLYKQQNQTLESLINTENVNVWRKSTITSKQILENITRVLKNTNNVKLILMTATPISDKVKEIIDLINLLRFNDNREKLNVEEGTKILEGNDEKLKLQYINKICNGYVSYMGPGNNPENFAVKLYPSSIQNKKGFPIINTNMSEIQQKVYNKRSKLLESKNSKNIIKSNKIPLVNICTVIYPTHIYSLPNLKSTHKEYFNKYFIKNKDKYTEDFLNKKYKLKDSIFAQENIKNYSPKLQFIMNCISNSKKGIVLIHSQQIESGAKTIAAMLEYYGYKRLIFEKKKISKINNFSYINKNKKNKTYVYIENVKQFTPLRNIINGEKNKNGDEVKVIIITKAASESISFYNIRQIHIVNPWHNINDVIQAEGRGIRSHGHNALDKKEQNVILYYHCTNTINNKHNSADKERWLLTMKKYNNTQIIIKYIASNSINCGLNYKENTEKKIGKTNMIDCYGNNNDITSVISTQITFDCNMKSQFIDRNEIFKNIENNELIINKIKHKIDNILQNIIPTYLNIILTFDKLDEIGRIYNIPVSLIEFSINFAEKNKIIIRNSKQIEGYIQTLLMKNKKIYLFNPKWNEKSTIDMFLPLLFRKYGPLYKKKDIYIPKIEINPMQNNFSKKISIIFEKIDKYKNNDINRNQEIAKNTKGWDIYNYIYILLDKYKILKNNKSFNYFLELIKYSKINHLHPKKLKSLLLRNEKIQKYKKYTHHFFIENDEYITFMIPENNNLNFYKIKEHEDPQKITSQQYKSEIYNKFEIKLTDKIQYLGFYDLNSTSNIVEFKLINNVKKFLNKNLDNRNRPMGKTIKNFPVEELFKITKKITKSVFPSINFPDTQELGSTYTKDFLYAEIELLFLYNHYYNKTPVIKLLHINEYIIIKKKIKK